MLDQSELNVLFEYKDGRLAQKGWLVSVYRNKANRGYLQVRVNHKLEQLRNVIWVMFNGPIPENMLVAVIDDNPENCKIENLILEMRSNLSHGRPKLRASDVRAIRRLYPIISHKEFASMFGVTVACIRSVRRGTVWKGIS